MEYSHLGLIHAVAPPAPAVLEPRRDALVIGSLFSSFCLARKRLYREVAYAAIRLARFETAVTGRHFGSGPAA